MDKNDANLICYYIVSPPYLDENRPNNNLDDVVDGRLSPPSRKITDKLDLTNDLLAMTLDSLDSLDGPTEADLFGDDDDILGDSSAKREQRALKTLSLRHGQGRLQQYQNPTQTEAAKYQQQLTEQKLNLACSPFNRP